MSELKRILMERDGMSAEEADYAIRQARRLVYEGNDPEEVLEDEFGLEPDYIFDII
jgi:hypothetical protein